MRQCTTDGENQQPGNWFSRVIKGTDSSSTCEDACIKKGNWTGGSMPPLRMRPASLMLVAGRGLPEEAVFEDGWLKRNDMRRSQLHPTGGLRVQDLSLRTRPRLGLLLPHLHLAQLLRSGIPRRTTPRVSATCIEISRSTTRVSAGPRPMHPR